MKISDRNKIKEIYKDGLGNWTIDLKEGYTTPYGTTYIINKTKKECLNELEFVK